MPEDRDRGNPKKPRLPVPDELLHRYAHEAANRAAGKHLQKITWAYETMFWDDAAKRVLASIASIRKGGKFPNPEDAAEMAADYADALVAERRRRTKKLDRGRP